MSKDIQGDGGSLPLEVRKALLILGVPSDAVTCQVVIEAWKKQIVDLLPDKGGETETAIILNTAKDRVVHWLESSGGSRGPNQPSSVPRRPHPSAGDNVVVLPIPKSSNNDDVER